MKRFAVLLVGLVFFLGAASYYQQRDAAVSAAWARNPSPYLTDEYIEANREALTESYFASNYITYPHECLLTNTPAECKASLRRFKLHNDSIRDWAHWRHTWKTVEPAAERIQERAEWAVVVILVLFGLAFLWETYRALAAHVFPTLRAKSAAVSAAVESRAAAMRGDSTVRSAAREIDDLSRLREHGVITEEEFDAAKKRIASRVRGDASV